MPRSLPDGVSSFVDRHGKRRYRFRLKGYRARYLPDPNVDLLEFRRAYADALQGESSTPHFTKDSVEAAVRLFFDSQAFTELRPVSQAGVRNMMNRLRREFGAHPLRAFTPRRIRASMTKLSDGPGGQMNVKKAWRRLFSWALEEDFDPLITHNPAREVKSPKLGEGAEPWSPEDVDRFDARWPMGTKQRAAKELIYWTGLRISDVGALRRDWDHVDEIRIPTSKTGAFLVLAVSPELRQALDSLPDDGPFFIGTDAGKQRSTKSIPQWFSKASSEAGNTNRTAHGLRKTYLSDGAEEGLSEHHLKAMGGHRSARELERYTRAARQRQMNREAIERLIAYRTAKADV